METQFTWKTKFFSNLYEISRYENAAGELRSIGWKRKSAGELNGKRVLFEIKGFFDKDFLISNPDDNSIIGKIVFNIWKTKATITILDKKYSWQYDNFFHSRWSISNENGSIVKYESHIKNGDVTSYTDDEILILTGLYIKDYLRQRAAAAAAAST
ncbi:MAG: hypothetical protein ABSA76_09165 [Bacteroidales bacterium]